MPAIYQRLRYETELSLMAWHFSRVPASFSQEQNVLNKIYASQVPPDEFIQYP